jgi:hypothetical protein
MCQPMIIFINTETAHNKIKQLFLIKNKTLSKSMAIPQKKFFLGSGSRV